MPVTTSLLPLAATADTSWTIEPGAVLMILILGGLYLPRWWRVRRIDGTAAAPVWRLLSLLIGLCSLALALLSPIDVLAEQSFSFHMAQHMLLLDLVPIFCILGLNKILLRPATRRLQALERSLGPLMHPWVAVVLYIVAMWAWHVPGAYDSALENATVHVLEHVCFLSVGFLYWWQLLSPIRSRFHGGAMGPLLYMVSTKVGVGLLGILLTFAPNPLYSYYDVREGIFGLSAGVDQQIGGELMALEQTIVMAIALAYLLFRAIDQSEREQQRREALEDRAKEQRG